MDEPEVIGAVEAGDPVGDVPTGIAGLEVGIGELPEPIEGPTGMMGVDAGGEAAADGETVIVE